jgi:hypothetical protein
VTVRVSITTVPGKRATVARAYRQRVKEAFERAKIPMATPASMLLVQGDGAGTATSVAVAGGAERFVSESSNGES